METIRSRIEHALAGTSPVVRVCLMVFMAAATLVLAMHCGESLGKALYYLTH